MRERLRRSPERLLRALATMLLPALLLSQAARAGDQTWTSVAADGYSCTQNMKLSADQVNLLDNIRDDDGDGETPGTNYVDKQSGTIPDHGWYSVYFDGTFPTDATAIKSAKIYVDADGASGGTGNLVIHLSVDRSVTRWWNYDIDGLDSPSNANSGDIYWSDAEDRKVYDATGVLDTIAEINNCEILITNDSTAKKLYLDYIYIEVVYAVEDVSVAPTSGLTTTEAAGPATFAVELASEPTADVTITLYSDDTSEGTLVGADGDGNLTLTFTDGAGGWPWNVPQTVTVTGQDDADEDGNVPYTIVTQPAASGDPGYAGIDPPDVSVRNLDDETDAALVGWWKLDDASGLTALDHGGGNHGTLVNMAGNEWTAGVRGGALALDGGVEHVQATGYKGVAGAAARTVAAWIRTPPSAAERTVVSWGGPLMGEQYAVLVQQTFGTPGAVRIDVAAGYLVGDAPVDDGEWHHVAAVFPAGASDVTEHLLYVDGAVQGASATSARAVNTASAEDVRIGRSLASAYFGGTIDDVRIYDRDLSAAEVAGLAELAPVITSPPLKDAYVGQVYSYAVSATGNPKPVAIDCTGHEGVAWLDWDGATATLSGTPGAGDLGTVGPITVTASNGVPPDGTQQFVIEVRDVDPTFPFWYRFDEIAGPTARDSSGNGNDGLLANGPLWQPGAGVDGGALLFDGGDDIVEDADGEAYLNGLAALSIAVWLRADDVSQDRGFVTGFGGIGETCLFMRLDEFGSASGNPRCIRMGVNTSVGTAVYESAAEQIAAGEWRHYVMVWESGQLLKLYVNGVPDVPGDPGTVRPGTVFGCDTLIVGRGGNTMISFPGMIDDFRLYGRPLTQTEVEDLYNSYLAGVVVSPVSGLVTSEDPASPDHTATFTVVLKTQPTDTVTISLASNAPGEGIVTSATPLVFDAGNWHLPQEVTVTGVDDGAVVDGHVAYTVVLDPAVSGDPAYGGLDPDDVQLTNMDDEPYVWVTPTSGLETAEDPTAADHTATFEVWLNTQPALPVTVDLAVGGDPDEATLSDDQLVFDGTNWDVKRTVVVTGADDPVVDGHVPYTVVVTASTSDPDYAGVEPDDVSLVNRDDEPFIWVEPVSGLVTSEDGAPTGTATFEVWLNTQPTNAVTFTLYSDSADDEGNVAPLALSFLTTNWDQKQMVTVTGVDDLLNDRDQDYTIVTNAATSTDTDYDGMNPPDVSVTNLDNDAGVVVEPVSGLVTTEDGGTAEFTVRLRTQPTADVTVTVWSDNQDEGTVDGATGGPPPKLTLTFTTFDWNEAKSVTVTGVDDTASPQPDGQIAYLIVVDPAESLDPDYLGYDGDDVSVTNMDNDAHIHVSPTSGLVTSESAGTATFEVWLNTQPQAGMPVTIGVSSDSTAEGEVTSPAGGTLTFDETNWDVKRMVTVTGVDDDVDDGDVGYGIVTDPAASADPAYGGRDADDVSVTNTDDDTAGFTVAPLSGLVTSESGTAATFTVRLTSEPVSPVTVLLTSTVPTEGLVTTPMSGELTFDDTDWDVDKQVVVTGQDDAPAVVDGDQPYEIDIAASGAGTAYDGLAGPSVSCTNEDNEPFVAVVPASGLVTTEGGGQATFTVALATDPGAPVTISVASLDPTEGLAPALLTFDPTNYDDPQQVTVTGADDPVADGHVLYTVELAQISAPGTPYDGFDPDDVTVTNRDDETDPLAGPGTGLLGEYWSSYNADMSTPPVITRIDTYVDFPDNSFPWEDNFTVRWTGEVFAPDDGTYTFRLDHDDGVRLRVDGEQIIDSGYPTGTGTRTGTIDLVAGEWYPIELHFTEAGGMERCHLIWTTPITVPVPTLIEQQYLYPAFVPTAGQSFPEADAHVRGGVNADTNYGTFPEIGVDNDSNPDFAYESYVRFDLSSIPGSIASAKVVLFPLAATWSGASCRAEFVSDDFWIETGPGGITWNTAPASSTLLDEWTAVAGERSELDVTAQAQTEKGGDGALSARLYAAELGHYANFGSKENPDPDRWPYLVYWLKTRLAADDFYYTAQDTQLVVSDPGSGVLGNDDDGAFAAEDVPPSNGVLALAPDGTFTYTPDGGFVGTDIFRYWMQDTQGGGDSAEVRINVGHNPPVVNDDGAVTDEDTPVSIGVLANDTNPEGDGLAILSFVDGAHGWVSYDAGSNALVYTPHAEWHGVDTFTYRAADDRGGVAEATVTVTVSPVNDVPVAADDAANTFEGAPVSVPVLANDTDADGEALAIVATTDPANGTATIVGDRVLYDPGMWTGVATFDYTVEDPMGAQDTATVTVTVDPNDLTPPWAHRDVGNAGSGGDSGALDVGGTAFTASARGDPGIRPAASADNFHFVYRVMTGQFEIVARLTSQDGTDPDRRAGLMVREDVDGDSMFAAVVVRDFGDGTIFERHQFLYRDRKGGESSMPPDVAADPTGAVWLRLVRRDEDGVHAYRSADGVTWEYLRGQRLAMADAVYVGLVVTSDNAGQLSTATFDNVSVTGEGDHVEWTTQPGWLRGDIGTPNAPGFADYYAGTGVTELWAAGEPGLRSNVSSDEAHFVYREGIAGDFEVTADLVSIADEANALGLDSDRRAGLVIRESLAGDAAYAALTRRGAEGFEPYIRLYSTARAKAGRVSYERMNYESPDNLTPLKLKLRRVRRVDVTTGADGICDTAAAAADLQLIPVGRGLPHQKCIDDGPNGMIETSPGGDDYIYASEVRSGENGICETVPAGDDMYANGYSLGTGRPDQRCVAPGLDQVLDTAAPGGDDEMRDVFYAFRWGAADTNWAFVNWNCLHATMPDPVLAGAFANSDLDRTAYLAEFENLWAGPIPVTLPGPWQRTDIGHVEIPAFGDYYGAPPYLDAGSLVCPGEFRLGASGRRPDNGYTEDRLHFVYLPTHGDGEIVARVTGVADTSSDALAGVMIRAGLGDTSAMAMAGVRPRDPILMPRGERFVWRSADGEATSRAEEAVVKPFPCWVKLVRAGDQVSGFYSPDGAAWTQIGTAQTVTAAEPVYVGLAVASNSYTRICPAIIDSVSLTFDTTPPEVDAVTSDLAPGEDPGLKHGTNDFEAKALVRITITELYAETGLTGTVTITTPSSGTLGPFATVELGAGAYAFDWDTGGLAPGAYEVRVTLADAGTNTDTDGVDAVDPDLTITLQDTAAPAIASVTSSVDGVPGTTWEVGAVVTISVTEADFETGLTASADISGPGGFSATIPLSDPDGDGTYTGDWDTQDRYYNEGDFTITVSLADADTPPNVVDNSASPLVVTVTPDVTPPVIEDVDSTDGTHSDELYTIGVTVTVTVTEASGETGLSGTAQITSSAAGYDSGAMALVGNGDGTYSCAWDTTGLAAATDYEVETTLQDNAVVPNVDSDGSVPGGPDLVMELAGVTVRAVDPGHGPTAGGKPVTVTGTGFQSGATVTFGGDDATAVAVVDDQTITCDTPAHATAEVVDVIVTNPDMSSATGVGLFEYLAPPVLSAVTPDTCIEGGETPLEASGANLDSSAAVYTSPDELAWTPASSVTWVSTGLVRFTPALIPQGVYSVKVVNPGGEEGVLSSALTVIPRFEDIAAGLPAMYDGAAAWGDYDGDGMLDLALSGMSPTAVYHNDGGGAFSEAATLDAGVQGGTSHHIAWGDYDADGDVDLAVAGMEGGSPTARIHRNDGASFADILAPLVGVRYACVDWGDCDSDGDLDLVIAGNDGFSNQTHVYLNEAGSFVDTGILAPVADACDWGDYDGDGDLDLALVYRSATDVYRNDGDGGFSPIGAGLHGVGGSAVAWGDYDNDGDLDLALAGQDAGYYAHIYRNDDGAFTDILAPLVGVWECSVAWGDYDNDGDLDLAVSGRDAVVQMTKIYLNSGGVFQETQEDLPATSFSTLAWGDYDNDGDLDLAFDYSLGDSCIYRNNCTVPNAPPTAPKGLTVALSGTGPFDVTFSWDPASDAETPTPGLSYNIRVGTSPGACDVVSPMADAATGFRRVAERGPVQGTSWTLKGLAPGLYYWSVQAVDTAFAGGAWAEEEIVPFPNVTGVTPALGPAEGAFTATVTGTGFEPGASVTFGASPAIGPVVLSPTEITCMVPAGTAWQAVEVTVTNPSTASGSLAGGFTYTGTPSVANVLPVSGPSSGGTDVTITGTYFWTDASGWPATSPPEVLFDGVPAVGVWLPSPGELCTELYATTPPGSVGSVAVTVTNPDGQTDSLGSAYEYLPPPMVVTSVDPDTGPVTITVTVYGYGFVDGATVEFGAGNFSPLVTWIDDGTLEAEVPPGSGTVDVTVTNPSSDTWTLTNGFTYGLIVSSVAPPTGVTPGGDDVTITGLGFDTVGGATVWFDGVPAAGVTVVSATEIRCTTPAGVPGLVDVLVQNVADGASGFKIDAFEYVPPLWLDGGLSPDPNQGSVLGGEAISIFGGGIQNPPDVFFGAVASPSVTYVSANYIIAEAPPHAAGLVDVKVVNPDSQEATLPASYLYVPLPLPQVTGVDPASGPEAGGVYGDPGGSVTITGQDFVAPVTVEFGTGNPSLSVSLVNSTTILAQPPPGAGTVDVIVTNVDGQSTEDWMPPRNGAYTYVPPPAAVGIDPSSADPSDVVTVSGTGFDPAATVEFGAGNAAVVLFVSGDGTQIEVEVPPGEGTVDVIVTNPDTQSDTLAGGFTYLPPAPAVVSISPFMAPEGTTVTIGGADFLDGATVQFGSGNYSPTVTFVSDTELTAVAPPGTGTVDIIVTNPGGKSGWLVLAFLYAPRIDTIAPDFGPLPGGTTVTITGLNFINKPDVWFGAAQADAADVTWVSATELTVVTPPGAVVGLVGVMVMNPDGGMDVEADGFRYDPPPVIIAFAPDHGLGGTGGTLVDILGSGFQDGAEVKFGANYSGEVTFVSAGQLTAIPPPGAFPGEQVYITVMNPDGQQFSSQDAIPVPLMFTYDGNNTAPTLDPVPTPQWVDEGATLQITLAATDPEDLLPEFLTYSAANTPANSTMDPGGVFSFTPDNTQGGAFWTVTFQVEDSAGGTDSQDVVIYAINVGGPGDLDGDNDVDMDDFLIIDANASRYYDDPLWDPRADPNGDGVTNLSDLMIVARNWLVEY